LSGALRDLGVRRQVESWGVDIPDGKVTDFRKAVDARSDETVVLAWFEYPDRKTRDAANEKMMSDPRMEEMGTDVPFDGKRMIFGGFDAIVEEGGPGGSFTDGMIVPVKDARREDYRAHASRMAKVFRHHGANRVIETLADDVQHGKVTDFYRAVKAEDGETIAFSFIEWPDKATRDEAWGKIMNDESLRPEGELPFAGQRLFWGGFEKIVDTAQQDARQQTPVTA
jgi:uncharacterized protein YbaA (DUF1428 family)